MGNYFIDFQAREGCIGLKSNVQGQSLLKQEVGSLIVQTWQQKLPQWNPRETDFIVNQELKTSIKKEKVKDPNTRKSLQVSIEELLLLAHLCPSNLPAQ